jgi:putative peptidoglycan lipid II flippase
MNSLLSSESFKKGFVVSSFLNFIAKIIAFLNAVAIAYYFGTNAKTDVYFFCLSIILTVSAFLISLNSTIIIPEAMRMREVVNEKESQRFLAFFLYSYLLICLTLSIVLLCNPAGIFCVISKFSPQILRENILVLYAAIPLLILLTVNSFLTDILVSYKYFSASVLSTLLNSILSILFILGFHNKLNILSALIGVLIANVLQLCVNVIILKKRVNYSFGFKLIKLKRKTIRDILIAQAGNFATMITSYVPVLFISKFQSGTLSAISYGAKIPDVITLLITVQFGSVIGIKFNELYAQNKTDEIKKTYMEASAFLQFVLFPICVMVFYYSQDIISIIFGHGAFNAASVSNASQFMRYFILVLPLTAHNAMVARLFMAAQKIDKSYLFQILMSCLMVSVIYVFISVAGAIGYPISLLVFYLVNTIGAIVIMRKNFKFIPYEETLFYSIKCIFLNVPIVVYLILLNILKVRHSILNIGTTVVLCSVVLIALNQKIKMNNTVRQAIQYLGLRLFKIQNDQYEMMK